MVILCGEERDVFRLQGRDADEFYRIWLGLANVDEREMLGGIGVGLARLLFADKGLISPELACTLAGRGVTLVTPLKLARVSAAIASGGAIVPVRWLDAAAEESAPQATKPADAPTATDGPAAKAEPKPKATSNR